EALAAHLRALSNLEALDLAMVGYRLEQTLSPHGSVSRGVCTVAGDGCLSKVVERTKIESTSEGIFARDREREERMTGREIVSWRWWGLTPALFSALERLFVEVLGSRGEEEKSEFYIPTAVDRLVSDGEARVSVLPTEDSWFGVTYPEDKP